MKMIEGRIAGPGRSRVRHQPRPPPARPSHLHRRGGQPGNAAGDLRQLRPGPRRHGPERRADPGDGHREVPGARRGRVDRHGRTRWRSCVRSRPRCCSGDVRQLAELTTANFFGPIQTIIPWATNHYTQTLIERARDRFGPAFWGFLMLGGMSGGGMGFIFDPGRKPRGPGLPPGTDERHEAAAAECPAVRHGAGGLRFFDQRPRHRGDAAGRRRGLHAAGLLRDVSRRSGSAATSAS